MLPSRVFLIKYKKNYLGHTCVHTNVFGFIKEIDADKVTSFLKFDTQIKKIDDFSYVISKKSKLKRPLDMNQLSLIQADPLVTHLEFAINNVKLDLIDEVTSNQQGLTLTSNFNLDVELDQSFMIDRLNALYKDEPYELINYMESHQDKEEEEEQEEEDN